jgi:hypothetical protein
MVEIKNIHGDVIARVENPEEVIRDIHGEVADILLADLPASHHHNHCC